MCSKCILSIKRFTGWLVQRCHSFPGRSEGSCWHASSSLWHRCQPKLHNSIWLVCWNVFIIDVIKTIRKPQQHSVRFVAFKLGSIYFGSFVLHDYGEIFPICSFVRNNEISWEIVMWCNFIFYKLLILYMTFQKIFILIIAHSNQTTVRKKCDRSEYMWVWGRCLSTTFNEITLNCVVE